MHVLMTWFGSALCYNRQSGALSHRHVTSIPDEESLVEVADPELSDRLVARLPEICRSVRPDLQRSAGSIAFERGVNGREDGSFTLARDGAFLSAREWGKIGSVAKAQEWEQFILVPSAQFRMLGHLCANSWTRRSTGSLIGPDQIQFQAGFILDVGGDQLHIGRDIPQLDYHDPAADVEGTTVLNLFFDGWRIEELTLFKPLVYVVAYGKAEFFDMMKLCLRSLVTVGEYQGDILVIGDRTRDEIARMVPEVSPERLHVLNLRAGEFVDYCSARYCLPQWEKAASFQPFLYMDLDVLVDQPISPLLGKLATQARISAQTERFAKLSKHAPCGSKLIKEDGLRPGRQRGFNSGILGIPSLRDHAPTLRKIHDLIYRYAHLHGSASLSHFDQAIANYATFKLWPIDHEFLTPRVRYTSRGKLEGGEEPRGFVHFWGSGKATVRVMADYLAERTAALRDAKAVNIKEKIAAITTVVFCALDPFSLFSPELYETAANLAMA